MRTCAHRRSRVLSTTIVATALLFANGGPSSIAVAQSDSLPLVPFRGLIDHVSVALNGFPSNTGVLSGAHSLSGDGRFVVMESSARDLIANDDNFVSDIFIRDRQTGTTARVSETYNGSVADGMSQSAAISTSGRYVAFASGASNLVADDTNGVWDIFVRDLQQGTTVRVSLSTAGAQSDTDSFWPAISANGRFVAFTSAASTLAPGGVPGQPNQAYVHDRDTDGNGIFDEPNGTSTSLVSVGYTGGFADGHVDGPRVSADGRYVLFGSQATNLDALGNPEGWPHLYRRDLRTGETMLIDRAATGAPSGRGVSWRAWDMSDDARYVTYASMSGDIVPFEINFTAQVYRYDAATNTTVMVSALPDGTIGAGSAFATSVSADGRYVAFSSTASNLVSPAPSSSNGAIIVRDMQDGTFTRVDVVDGGLAFDHSFGYSPSLSADGTAIAFQSNSQNAVDGINTFGADHVFVATAFTVSTTAVTVPGAGGAGSIDVNTTPVSGWNAVSLDSWISLTEGGGFGAGPRTVRYLVDANAAGIVRDGRIRLGSTVVTVHQEGDGDPTPPIITPIVTGNLTQSGWYVGPVTVQFTVVDAESPIVSQSYGCGGVTITGDTMYAPVTCEATSHGGVNSSTVVVKIDNTPPTISIATPAASVYAPNTIVAPSFSCSEDSNYSGVANCSISEGSSPLDTTPGRHVFAITATDNAGNSTTKRVEYLVGTGVCVPPVDSLKAWWRFEGTTLDQLNTFFGDPVPSGPVFFAPGVAGQSWQAQSTTYLVTHDGGRLLATDAITIAAWLKPAGHIGESGTIVSKPSQYRVARYGDGTLRWAFNQNGSFDWINTGVVIPSSVWTHVAVVYDHGVVKTYMNGRLAHTYELTGTLAAGSDPAPLTIAGRADASASYFGWLDELQIFMAPLSASEVENIALAGGGSICLPQPTELTLSVPSTVPFGSTFQATATLRDMQGQPVAGKTVNFSSYVSAGGNFAGLATGTTDNAGQVQAPLPIAPDAPAGPYTVTAQYSGDVHYAAASTAASLTLAKATPSIAWPTPSAIVYGTALGASQLNATANAAGTFTYSPAAGTLISAGTHVVTVTFTPSDTEHWNTATATATIVVNKATPVVTITGGTFTYDKQPHAAVVQATGVLGEALSPVQVLYDGTSQTPPVNAGVYSVSASFGGSENYTSASAANVSLVINKAVPTVAIAGGPFIYNGQPRQATVSVQGVGGDVLSPVVVRYDGAAALPVDAGSHVVSASYSGEANYQPVSAEGTLVIDKATPLMSLSDVTLTYDGQPHGVSVNVLGVVNDWLTPVVVTYNGSTTMPTDAGVYTMEARYDGSTNYKAISKTATLTILKAQPYLTWRSPASIFYGTALGSAQLNADANVQGTFTYTPSAGAVLNAGEHVLSVAFTPADTVNYTSQSTTVTLLVNKAFPSLSWQRPADIVYGTPLGNAQLNAASTAPGTFVYTPSAGTVVDAGEHVLSATFTPDDPSNYLGGSVGAPITVTKATPSIAWATPADIVYGSRLNSVQLNAIASVPGTYSYTPGLDTVLSAGTHTLSVTFTPNDAANYSSAEASASINVTKATPWIAWETPADVVYGTALSGAQLNATANVPGTLSYSPSAGTVLNAGPHTLTVAFTPDDAANYTAAEATVTLNVAKASSSIAWAQPADIVYGTALSGAQLNATANVAGTFNYSPSAGTVLNAGPHAVSVTFTPDDSANYTGAEATVTVNVTKASSSIAWAQPADIVYGTALSGAQLNATANVPGTFSYSPSLGTVLNAGSRALTVTFTPDDAANYTGAEATVTVNVTKASSSVTWGTPGPIVYGTPLGAAQLNATANVPGTFSYSPSAGTVLNAGSYTATVTFTPTDGANYTGSSATTTITVARAPLTIAANASTKVFGAALPVFSATTSGFVNGDSLASLTGALSFSTPATAASAVGSYPVTPQGLSSGNYGIAFVAGTLTVLPASTATAVAASANPTGYNQPVTFTAAVSAVAPGAGAPAGVVQFYDSGTLVGSAPLVAGTATLTTNGLSSGSHTITATYSGETSFTSSTGSMPLTVRSSSNSSSTSLTSSDSSSTDGQSVTFTATVSASNDAVSGNVAFYDGSVLLATVRISDKTARFTTSALAVGGHAIVAVYLGSSSTPPSTSPVLAQAVQPSGIRLRSSTVTLSASPSPSTLGSAVTLTANISGSFKEIITGQVVFFVDGVIIGTGTVASTGSDTARATFSSSTLPRGTHRVEAVYLGDDDYRADSASVTLVVN